jgi:hypothetical protein
MPSKILFLVFMMAFGVSAQTSLTFTNFTPGSFSVPGSGLIDNNGFTDIEAVNTVPGISLTTLLLTLDFQDNPEPGLTGVLTLYTQNGTLLDSVDLSAITGTYNSSGPFAGDYTYQADFSTAFSGQNPNNNWGLALAFPEFGSDSDNENNLNSWSLDVLDLLDVPEPGDFALAGIGAVFAAVTAGRRYLRTLRQHKKQS